MIVECSGCGSKYNIPDEKIGETTKRFRCKRCDEMIIIRPSRGQSVEESPGSSETPDIAKKEASSRFARVLASDMFEYNKDIIELGRKEGNLSEVMEDEIARSWELWRNKYPLWSRKAPRIFRDALNYFIADGEDLFDDWQPPR